MMSRMVIVAGANSELAPYYIAGLPGDACVTISRRPLQHGLDTEHLALDLLDAGAWRRAASRLLDRSVDELYVLHLVGEFALEHDTSMQRMLDVNYRTLVNLMQPLRELHVPKTVVCSFGSVSDKYDVPLWRSYSRSKRMARELLKDAAQDGCRCVYVATSTIDTASARRLLPDARDSWLTPAEVADASLPAIRNAAPGYRELEVYRPRADFSPGLYFTDRGQARLHQ